MFLIIDYHARTQDLCTREARPLIFLRPLPHHPADNQENKRSSLKILRPPGGWQAGEKRSLLKILRPEPILRPHLEDFGAPWGLAPRKRPPHGARVIITLLLKIARKLVVKFVEGFRSPQSLWCWITTIYRSWHNATDLELRRWVVVKSKRVYNIHYLGLYSSKS